MKSNLLRLCACALAVALPVTVKGQYAIDWFTIDGGGGTSTGGVYSVTGTIGQADAGTMSGGSYSLAGGFWNVVAVQTPGMPQLKVSFAGPNQVIISWPSTSTGFTLQQNSGLDTSTWNTPAENIADNGTNKFIIVNPPAGNRYYRLIRP